MKVGALRKLCHHSNMCIDNSKPQGLKQPSDYLRERCPLCFGGSNWAKPDEVYVIIMHFK